MEEGWGDPGASGAKRRTLANGRGQSPLDQAALEERPAGTIHRAKHPGDAGRGSSDSGDRMCAVVFCPGDAALWAGAAMLGFGLEDSWGHETTETSLVIFQDAGQPVEVWLDAAHDTV